MRLTDFDGERRNFLFFGEGDEIYETTNTKCDPHLFASKSPPSSISFANESPHSSFISIVHPHPPPLLQTKYTESNTATPLATPPSLSVCDFVLKRLPTVSLRWMVSPFSPLFSEMRTPKIPSSETPEDERGREEEMVKRGNGEVGGKWRECKNK